MKMIDNGETFERLYGDWMSRKSKKKEMDGEEQMTVESPILDLNDLINMNSEIDFMHRVSLAKAKEYDDLVLEDSAINSLKLNGETLL